MYTEPTHRTNTRCPSVDKSPVGRQLGQPPGQSRLKWDREGDGRTTNARNCVKWWRGHGDFVKFMCRRILKSLEIRRTNTTQSTATAASFSVSPGRWWFVLVTGLCSQSMCSFSASEVLEGSWCLVGDLFRMQCNFAIFVLHISGGIKPGSEEPGHGFP